MVSDTSEPSEPNDRLRRQRELRAWTLNDTADALYTLCVDDSIVRHRGDINAQMISRWERGKHPPSPFWQKMLCKLYGKSVEELGFVKPQPLLGGPSSSTFLPLSSSTQTDVPISSLYSRNMLPRESTDGAVFFDEGGHDHAYSSQQETPEPSLQAPLLFEVGIWMLSLARLQAFWTPTEFMKHVAFALENTKGMNQRKLSRREALELLVSLTIGLLSPMHAATSFAAEEVVSLCATSIPACWGLFWEGEFSEVERALPTYFSQLTPLARQHSKYQKSAARLVSQVHQIASLLILEREDFGTSLAHCKKASLYGQIAGDPNLQSASLIRQANTLFYRHTVSYLKRHAHILQTYQEAVQSIDEVSPLICGRIYSGLASAQATLGQKQQALRHIGLAQEAFPEHPEEDPGFLYTNTTHYILYFNEALAYLNFEQPKQAWDALAKAATFVPNEVSPRGMELQNHRVIISMALGNLDQSCMLFETLVSSGCALESDLHQNEAHATHEQMLTRWPHEKRVKELAECFQQ